MFLGGSVLIVLLMAPHGGWKMPGGVPRKYYRQEPTVRGSAK